MRLMKQRRSESALRTILATFAILGAMLIGSVVHAQPASAYTARNLPPKQSLLLQQMYGKSFPAQLLDNLTWKIGEPATFESMRGKVVVLQLWRTGGASDRSLLAIANASQKRFGQEDLAVIAIHTNERMGQAEAYIKEKSFPVTTAIDTNGALTRFLHGRDNPMNIVIDRQGAVVAGGLTGRGLNVMIKNAIEKPFDAAAPLPTMFIDTDGKPVADQAALSNAAPIVEKIEDVIAVAAPDGFPPYTNRVSSALDSRGKKAPGHGNLTWLTDAPDTQGKVLIIDFWATWCGPCVASIPKMNEHAERFAEDVVIIGLTDEKENVVRKFLKKTEFGYPVATNEAAQMQHALQVRGIPHVVVISPDGIIRFQGHPAFLTDAIIAQIVLASKSLNN